MPEFIVKTYTPRAASGVRPQPRRTEDRSQRDRAKDTQTTMYHAGATTVWADALFVSVLQRSDQPGTGQVRQAIAAAVQAYGDQGCAQRVAQEFGDHPETAAARMHWAHAVASTMPGSPPQAGHGSPRTGRITGLPIPGHNGRGRCSASARNSRNNLYPVERDQRTAFYTEGDEPG